MELFVLAIDHRNSLRGWYRGRWGSDDDERRTLTVMKSIVVDALIQAVNADPALSAGAGMLIDDEYGSTLVPGLRSAGVRVITPVERSGQAEFEFEHGDEWSRRIDEFGPDMVKALVRYNATGDRARNARSTERLVGLQSALSARGLSWVLELLVPPEPEQLRALGNDPAKYDCELRPALAVRAIDELMAAGLRPDYWKLEGFATRTAFSEVARQVLVNPSSRLLVLGRGENYPAVERWLDLAGRVDGFVGFAIGRTLWEQPLVRWRSNQQAREDVAGDIAKGYSTLVKRFHAALAHRARGDQAATPTVAG